MINSVPQYNTPCQHVTDMKSLMRNLTPFHHTEFGPVACLLPRASRGSGPPRVRCWVRSTRCQAAGASGTFRCHCHRCSLKPPGAKCQGAETQTFFLCKYRWGKSVALPPTLQNYLRFMLPCALVLGRRLPHPWVHRDRAPGHSLGGVDPRQVSSTINEYPLFNYV